MGSFFGTDGIRWNVQKESSCEISYKCGNAIGGKGKRILIGRDTRNTGFLITLLFSAGVLNAGGSVVDVGVCPTAGVAYLTKKHKFDYGVVISASHNPADYNGIKLFNMCGTKLRDKIEGEIEKKFFSNKRVESEIFGTYSYKPNLLKEYEDFLLMSTDFRINKKIVLDCSNGAAAHLAPKIFKKLGAQVLAVANRPNGRNINENCGALNIQNLQKLVLNHGADIGFAFDGDSDRVLAVDETGSVVDGDKIVYMLATTYQKLGLLKPSEVVGTIYTNMAMEIALQEKGIKLLRADVGDKYVSEKLTERNLLIGGESSGHIFVKDKIQTGDGILNAILIATMCETENKKLSEFFDYIPFFMHCENVHTDYKLQIMESERLKEIILKTQKELKEKGRVIVRPSGTEPLIRVAVECACEKTAEKYVKKLVENIKILDLENVKCVE